MKNFNSVLIAFTALLFLQSAKAQTADEIVAKYIDALGGKEKLASMKSVKMNGSLSVQGFDVGIVVTVVNGVGFRTDITVPGMGDGFQIMNTKKGWNFLPFQGQASPEEVSAEQVAASQGQLDLQGALVDYKEKGSQLELLGKEAVDGAETFKLKMTNKAGKVSTHFIDSKTFYRVKAIAKAQTPQGEMEVTTGYGDFKKTPEGFVFPYSQTTDRGTIVFSTIDVNKPVDEKVFTAE